MRVLLDECLPRKLKRILIGFDVKTVQEMGWAGIKNGQLLNLMEASFDVFITIDSNLQYQQNLEQRTVAVIVLSASNNTFEALEPLLPGIFTALRTIQPKELRKVSHLHTPRTHPPT